jgi:hypothetical protein
MGTAACYQGQDSSLGIMAFRNEEWLYKNLFKPLDLWGDWLSITVPGAAYIRIDADDCHHKEDQQLIVILDYAVKIAENINNYMK